MHGFQAIELAKGYALNSVSEGIQKHNQIGLVLLG
jgi:hypothetical protein